MSSKFFSKPEAPEPVESNEPKPAQDAPVVPVVPADDGEAQAAPDEASGKMAEIAGMLNNHKGKLAVGAAAMLGVAIFYKWRENKLAKEDPEEYARLKRLKKAIDSDADTPEQDMQGKAE
jgi:hypothetical protein